LTTPFGKSARENRRAAHGTLGDTTGVARYYLLDETIHLFL
jgi:hypothetical protein